MYNYIIPLVEKKHDIGKASSGFECHPDITPFDELAIKIIKEIAVVEAKKLAEKKKQAFKQSSMLAHEATYCPVINMTKKTSEVVNDVGEVIEKALPIIDFFELEEEDDSIENANHSSSSSTSTMNKKRSADHLTSTPTSTSSTLTSCASEKTQEKPSRKQKTPDVDKEDTFLQDLLQSLKPSAEELALKKKKLEIEEIQAKTTSRMMDMMIKKFMKDDEN